MFAFLSIVPVIPVMEVVTDSREGVADGTSD
jgi:hypothetical protein